MGEADSQSPPRNPVQAQFAPDVMDAFSSQAASQAVKAVPGVTRKAADITDGPRFTPAQMKDIVLAAMREFDPALGARAEKIFAAGYDAAAQNAGTARPDWDHIAKTEPPSRWMLQEVEPGKVNMQRSLPAASPASELGPANPNGYSVIQYKFDGTIGSLVYLTHELGHSIADDNLQQTGAHKHSDNPLHMQETEAYFTQHVLYDYIRNHPELEKQYPGIAPIAHEHFNATMAENLARFSEPGYDVHGRPGAILGGLGLFELAKEDKQRRADVVASVMQAKGPKTFKEVIGEAGVKSPRDLESFAQRAVASATAHAPLPQEGVKAAVKTPVVNIVIDVGDWDPAHSKGSKPEHDAYIKKINDSVTALRQQGIPTIFVAITDDTVAHPAAQPRDPGLLKRLHMTELDIQPGDDIFEKRLMSGFTTLDDVKNSPTVEKYITGQRKDGANYKEAKWGKITLSDLLEAKGAEHVTLMGTVAQYCITDNAIDAAHRGLGVTVLTDTVAGWNDKSIHDKIVVPDDPKIAAKQVADTLKEVRENPEKRGIETADAPAAVDAMKKIKLLTVDRFLQSAPALKAEAVKPVAIAQSKFLAPKETAPHPDEPAHGPAKGSAVQEHGGTAMGVATVAVDLAEGRYGRAMTDATLQLSMHPQIYEAAAKLMGEAGSVAKLLGEFGKKIPIGGAILTGGFVLYEVGVNVYDGKFGKAGAALVAGAAETAGNVVGFGVGDLAREGVREAVVLTAGKEYAPNKSGLLDLGERAYNLGAKAIGGGAKTGPEAQNRPLTGPKLTI